VSAVVAPEARTREAPRVTVRSTRRVWVTYRTRRGQPGIVTALTIFAFVGLFPYLFMVVTSFKSKQQFADDYWTPSLPLHFENYATAWQQVQPYLLTSILVAGLAIVGVVILSLVTGFILARFSFPGRKLFFAMIAALMMIPSISSLIPLFIMMRDLGLLNTTAVLVIPHVAGGIVLGTVLMKGFIEGIPQSLFDAARMDGAGSIRLFTSIMLPLSLPVVGTVSLLTVSGVWNDFFWPLLTISDDALRPVSVGLLFFQGQNGTDYGPMFAGYLISSLPLVILFMFFSKYFLAGVQGGMTGSH